MSTNIRGHQSIVLRCVCVGGRKRPGTTLLGIIAIIAIIGDQAHRRRALLSPIDNTSLTGGKTIDRNLVKPPMTDVLFSQPATVIRAAHARSRVSGFRRALPLAVSL